jgi:hypothetical protein
MFQSSVDGNPKVVLRGLDEHYARFRCGSNIASVRLDKMRKIGDGVYKVEVFSVNCIVDTNIPIPYEGRELEAVV